MRPAAASLLLLLSSALRADGFAGSSGAPQSWAAGGRPCARGGAALRQAEPAGSGGPGALFPVLGRIAGGVWEGEMRYAGSALEPAPFVLSGTTRCELVGRRCTLESSVRAVRCSGGATNAHSASLNQHDGCGERIIAV